MLQNWRRNAPKPDDIARQRALSATMLPIAIGELLASVETLSVNGPFHRKGLLRGVSARSATPGTLRHVALTVLDSPFTPKILAAINLGASISLIVGHRKRAVQVAASVVIGTCNRLSEIRTPYGRDGADQMTALVMQYRALSALVPGHARSDDLFLRAVNFQAGLSYFVSGISKLFGSSWVQGNALGDVVQTDAYGGGPAAAFLRDHPRITRVLTWLTPLWEVCFPLVYVVPSHWGRASLMAVKGFHVGVTAAMELPRFVWGFTGSHGAVRYVIDRRRNTSVRLERNVLVSAAVVTGVSATYAASLRALDNDRRGGLKGTQLLDVADGQIEFQHVAPSDPDAPDSDAPVVLLEAGLGSALDAWALVRDAMPQCHVLSYHRAGYGRTTSSASPVEAMEALVHASGSNGPLIVAAHSIGLLAVAQYCRSQIAGRQISSVVIVDGTDPDVFAADRLDRRRRGAFIQSQLHSMFAALSGVYNFAPNAVARQARYEPDEQQGVIQFAFAPRNIHRSTREYFTLPTEGALDSLREVQHRFLIASGENADQQRRLAQKLEADYTLATGSSHRSILGFRAHAIEVASVIEEAVRAAS